jgi:hypothetical protein
MKKYYKLPIPVVVKFAEQSGEIRTLEGVVKYKKHDAILTGVHGEQWPIERVTFDKNYLPVLPTKKGENGSYVKSRVEVQAYQLASATSITIKNNNILKGNPGDWFITDANGDSWIVDDEIFNITYSKIV